MKVRMTVLGACVVLVVSMLSLNAHAANFTAEVVDGDGNPVSGFRWLLEEDNTHPVTPGVTVNRAGVPYANLSTPTNAGSADTSLAFDFHASHAPVATATNDGRGLKGETTGSSVTVENVRGTGNDPRRYYLSVLPYEGYTMGGAQVLIDSIGAQSESVTVIVQPHAINTAQISVFVFEDNQPLNNAPDLPEEGGLGGPDWTVVLFEAGGLYGIAGGQVLQDAFGNPLGTTYNPGDPNPVTMGDGILHPDTNGVVLIRNLVPAKYGIQVVPPPNAGWIQTSTIEGTKTIDAWVKSNEPSSFLEFGPPGHHAFIGFVQRDLNDTSVLTGGASISGEITNLHTSRPPDFTFYSGEPFPGCFVGLNDLAVGEGKAVFVQECDENSGFQIDGVPEGNYQLVVFDKNLDIIIALLGMTVDAGATTCNGGQSCDLAEVPVFNWFGKVDSWGFFDTNENGYWDTGEPNMSADSTALNLRFRNGQMYQSFPVDIVGNAPFDEVFPFFQWLVYEWDFATLKATGATFTTDDGGPLALGEITNPQPQAGLPTCTGPLGPEECTFDGLSSTVVGPALTQGFQVVLGQANVIEFGKGLYGTNENGGISGLVINTVTRAENDPRYAANEEWEALIPRAQVVLYEDNLDNGTLQPIFGGDGIVDDVNGTLAVEYADVDNYPLGWADGGSRGNEDIDHNGDGLFDLGDAIDVGWSDSWDDNKPTGCQGSNGPGFENLDCFDGLRNFNQSRPALFDGGYAFGPRYDCTDDGFGGCTEGHVALGADTFGYLKSGQYIVQGIAPPGYEHIKEEDRNVDFGDQVIPQLLPPECVGELRDVPMYMSMQTDSAGNCMVSGGCDDAPFAGDQLPNTGDERPLCDRKTIKLAQGQNAALDFHLMTETPKAARVVGFILDDFANEFDPTSPNFGEKWAPPWMPVSFRDFNGVEIGKTHADEFGLYNALLPSTFTANAPIPSGMGPNMLTACMNSANPIPNPDFDGTDLDIQEFIPDPFHNSQYSQFCYTFQYMPGSTTYLDTPVIPIAAFAGGGQFPVDCEYDTGTPRIASVTRRNSTWGPFVMPNQQLNIRSVGLVSVPNPGWDGTSGTDKTIVRDYGFGFRGPDSLVELVDENGDRTPLTIVGNNGWNPRRIRARVSGGAAPGFYQLVVTTDAEKVSPVGLTVTVGSNPPGPGSDANPVNGNVPIRVPDDYTTIQAAIDAAVPGDLILVAPGIYDELVIMYKPVQLQGWGAGSVTINGIKTPSEKLQAWRDKMTVLLGTPTGGVFPDGFSGTNYDLLPGQEIGFSAQDNEPNAFTTGEGPVIMVVAHRDDNKPNSFTQAFAPRIDGFTLTGADDAGGVFANGYADWLQISNNRIVSNAGWHGGGIRIGHADLLNEIGNNDIVVSDGQNDNIKIHHNQIAQNGSIGGAGGAGGGVALFTGADNYEVSDNLVCGNFANSDGAGIGHRGLSHNGLIEDNSIIFNQSFNQGTSASGAGIYIAGAAPLVPAVLTNGSGSVEIIGNLIQGNQAGAGDGGGIRTAFVNGQDVVDSPADETAWYSIDVFNNVIVNNVAGLAGGGMSLQDTANIRITNNTIANNDSTATAGEAFDPGSPNLSNPQPAGLVLRAHSAALNTALAAASGVPDWATRAYSQPHLFDNNILWHNRSFYYAVNNTPDPDTFGLCPEIGVATILCEGGSTPVYDDLAVLGTAATGLAPMYTLFSEGHVGPGFGEATNEFELDAGFIADYVNGGRGETIFMPETGSSIVAQPAFDEGGNFIDVRFGPLSLNVDAPLAGAPSDYHLDAGLPSPAIGIADTKTDDPLLTDIDGDLRTPAWDSGADETTTP